MLKVLGIGDNVCDVYLHKEIMYPGGQALNFTAYAKKLGADADFMGVFGKDAVAEHVKNTLDALGVGRTHCRSFEGENGFARVTLKEGDRVFMGSNRGGVIQEHPIFLDADDVSYVSGFDLVHTSNNGFTEDLLPKLKELPPAVSYDFSFRWNEEERVKKVCPFVDFAFLSCSGLTDEETEELCRKLHREGCGIVTATRGSKGAVVYDGRRIYRQLPHYVEPVDTMGAGDSFATALLVALLTDLKRTGGDLRTAAASGKLEEFLPAALDKAAAFAAETCLTDGAFGHGIRVPESVRSRVMAEKL